MDILRKQPLFLKQSPFTIRIICMLLTLYMLLIKEAAAFITDYLHPLNFFTVIKTKIHLEGYRSITLAKFMFS